MAKRGNPGYGKSEKIRENVDKFSDTFWTLMEEFAKSKSKEDKKFFIQEFNKIQTKMIPQTVQGDEDGGPIKVTVTNYGNTATLQIHSSSISTPTVIGD